MKLSEKYVKYITAWGQNCIDLHYADEPMPPGPEQIVSVLIKEVRSEYKLAIVEAISSYLIPEAMGEAYAAIKRLEEGR